MVHYPRIIQMCGPPRFFWCFLYEAKHKFFKTYCRIRIRITSRKNIAVSIAKKYQLQFAHLMLSTTPSRLSVLPSHEQYTLHLPRVTSFISLHNLHSFHFYHKCVYRGTKFKRMHYFCQFVDFDTPASSIVLRLHEIIVFRNIDEPFFVCKRVAALKYWPHYAALEIANCAADSSDEDTNEDDYVFFAASKLVGPPLNAHRLLRGQVFLRPKMYYE